jgi:hypothetical protein
MWGANALSKQREFCSRGGDVKVRFLAFSIVKIKI